MSKKESKGLWLTDEIRGKLHLAVEEAIKCHVSSMERNYHELDKVARNERIKLYKEVEEACEQMTETYAIDLLFGKYSSAEITNMWDNWKKKNMIEICPDCDGTGMSGEFDRSVPPNEYSCEACGGEGVLPNGNE